MYSQRRLSRRKKPNLYVGNEKTRFANMYERTNVEAAVADGTNLFVAEITCSNGASSCSGNMQKTVLVRMPAQGGTPQTIFQDPQLFINGIGLVDAQKLLETNGDSVLVLGWT